MYIQSKKARLLGLKLGLFDTQDDWSIRKKYLRLLAKVYVRCSHILTREGTLLVTDRQSPPCVSLFTDRRWTMITIPHGYCLPESIQDKDPRYGHWYYAGRHIQRYVNWSLHPRVKMSGLQDRDNARILVIHAIVDGRCLDHWYFGANVLVEDDL